MTWRRMAIPAGIGCVAALITWLSYRLPGTASDFDQLWVAARALTRGVDPYRAVQDANLPYPLFYPLPAVLLVVPLAALPLSVARIVWSGVGAGLMAEAAFRYGRGLPVALVSGAFASAVVQGQWSPLLTASMVLPVLAVSWVAKPSIGLAMAVAAPSRRRLGWALGLLVVSLGLMPDWPKAWFQALRSQFYMPLLLRPGGALLLLALLRWRRPEGRLLAALACLPHSPSAYETLPLFLIPQTRWQAYRLAVLGYIAIFLGSWLIPWAHTIPTLPKNLSDRWPFMLLLVYLPSLVMLLRLPSRPDAPAHNRTDDSLPGSQG
jgi:hypothetical protein